MTPRKPRRSTEASVSPRRYPFNALLIPADPSAPVELVTVDGHHDILRFLRGGPESTRYDLDSRMLVHGEGRILGLPLNARATHYIKTASAAARNRRTLPGDSGFPADYGLYGDVLAIGPDIGEDVPSRLVEWFETNADTEQMQPPRTGPFYCPRCESHSPNLHPAVQHEGEVIPCSDPFHGEYRPRAGESLRDFSRRAYGTGREGQS